jgi:hypothetical protein
VTGRTPDGPVTDGRPQGYDFGTEAQTGASGKQAAYIKARSSAPANSFAGLNQCVDAENYLGKRLRLTADLRSVAASSEQLFMRVDGPRPENGGPTKVLGFYNNAQNDAIGGTTEWKRYEVVLDVPAESREVCFGFLLAGGKGEAWADGFTLQPVGREVPVSVYKPPKRPVNLNFEQ